MHTEHVAQVRTCISLFLAEPFGDSQYLSQVIFQHTAYTMIIILEISGSTQPPFITSFDVVLTSYKIASKRNVATSNTGYA